MRRRRVLQSIGGIAGASLIPTTAVACVDNGNQPLDQQLEKVEEATKRYRDMEKALQDGYQIMGPYVPGMGWHFINPDRAQRAAEQGPNLVRPSALTYNLDGELGSVEYLVPADVQPDLFNDEDADRDLKVTEDEGWHVHGKAQHVFSNGNGEFDEDEFSRNELLNPDHWVELSDEEKQFPPMEPGLEPGDTLTADWNTDGTATERVVDMVETHPSQNTFHAWVHYENPAGVFAGFNPDFDQFDPLGGGEDEHDDHDHEH